jgi:hypothetical protein
MRRLATLIAVVLAATLAGCGGSEEDKAKKATLDFLGAIADEDLAKACPLMADSLKVRILGPLGDVVTQRKEECEKALRPRIGALPVVEDAEATRTQVTRANASVAVSGTAERGAPVRTTIELRKSGKEWLVTGF